MPAAVIDSGGQQQVGRSIEASRPVPEFMPESFARLCARMETPALAGSAGSRRIKQKAGRVAQVPDSADDRPERPAPGPTFCKESCQSAEMPTESAIRMYCLR
jgi:hypothetical protein